MLWLRKRFPFSSPLWLSSLALISFPNSYLLLGVLLDLGLGFWTWILDLDLRLDLGLTIYPLTGRHNAMSRSSDPPPLISNQHEKNEMGQRIIINIVFIINIISVFASFSTESHTVSVGSKLLDGHAVRHTVIEASSGGGAGVARAVIVIVVTVISHRLT